MKLLRKITDKRILYIFTICILIFLPILKQSTFYIARAGIINNHDSINPAYVLYFCIPFFIYIYIKNLIKTKRELDIYDYLFYVLVFAGIMSILFSLDKEIAILGKIYRHEGFLTIFCYYLLFITWKVEGNKKDIKIILNIITVMAIINSIYGLLQIYSPFKFILRYGLDHDMASGICGNPNFFGTYVVTLLGIVSSRFLIEKKIKGIDIFLIILFFISVINSQSTGPFLTVIVTTLFLIIYLLIKKKVVLKKMIILIILLPLTYIIIDYVNNEIFYIKKCEMCDLASEISGNNEENYSITNGRLEIWKNSLDIVKKYPIAGVGYDNFYLAYYEGVNFSEVIFVSMDGEIKAVKKYWSIIDNAHNVYLHTLVSNGLIGFIPYLILCLYTFIRGLKTKESLVIILLGGFVAYSVQAFGNINVLQVTPIYYIIIGLILSIKQ